MVRPDESTKADDARSTWEHYLDAVRSAPDEVVSSCRCACGAAFAKDRENLSALYQALKPKEIACLGSGCLNDIPIGDFLRGGSRVWLIDRIPGVSERGMACDLVRREQGTHACLVCELRDGAQFCKNFKTPSRADSMVCDNFCLLEGFPPRCTKYAPGTEPHILTADATLGRAACFATRAEELVAKARGPVQCFELALEECRRCCSETSRRLPVPSGSLDLVTSVMVMSQFEYEPYNFFSKLLARRFGEARLAEHKERLTPLMEELRSSLFRMQVEGHVQEMHRLVEKQRGRVYFSVELFEKHPERGDFFLVQGAPLMLEALGEYFFFDLELTGLDRALRSVEVGEGRSVIQTYVLAPVRNRRGGGPS
jgi:hypothetical protein